MPISDEKVEQILATLSDTMKEVKRVSTENSELHKEMILLLKANNQLRDASMNQTAQSPTKSSNKRKPDRPSVDAETDDIGWVIFKDSWQRYKRISDLVDVGEICLELRECCSTEVNKLLYQYAGSKELNATDLTEEKLMAFIKSVAVKSVHKEVHRWHFDQLHQEDGETITRYVGRLNAQAVLCNFTVKCGCASEVSYADEMISQRLIAGLINPDHQSKILAEAQDLTDLKSKVARLMSLETTDEATIKLRTSVKSAAAKVSSYRDKQRSSLIPEWKKKAHPSTHKEGRYPQKGGQFQRREGKFPRRRLRCRGCGRTNHLDGKSMNRPDCPAFGKTCDTCGKENHFAKVCESRKSRASYMRCEGDTSTSEYDGDSSETDEDEYESSCNLSATIQDFRQSRHQNPVG